MAELVTPTKIIHIDDADFDLLKDHQWRVMENLAGRIGRKLANGKNMGLAATLIGKRPDRNMHLAFRDKNLRNFSRSNIYWTDACYYCGRPLNSFLGTCLHCRTDFNINHR
jgi:hypothetical protein